MILAGVIITAFLLLSVAMANACGDKALRIGRGVRFQRTSHPASVLIYIPSNTARANQLQSLLKKLGHRPYAAQGADSVNEALKSGHYDLLFTDLADAAGLEKQVEASLSKPVLIPVLSEGTKAEIAAARKMYKYFVKDPHSPDNYLDAIDEATRSRAHPPAQKG
jgi:DNA-binding NtrC family response regulator